MMPKVPRGTIDTSCMKKKEREGEREKEKKRKRKVAEDSLGRDKGFTFYVTPRAG